MNKTLGKKIFDELKQNHIICCGTVMGKIDSFLENMPLKWIRCQKISIQKKTKIFINFQKR